MKEQNKRTYNCRNEAAKCIVELYGTTVEAYLTSVTRKCFRYFSFSTRQTRLVD